ncbi:MAG: ECF transporter S component [Rikenellaceae bacterium]|nr:ECF transporter S component [Rikenellaceae bacterium]
MKAVAPKTGLLAAVFVAANVALPQLFHVVNMGSAVFIPILFFTLLAGVRYGMVCGLATAILSPLVSAAITGMPAAPMLWILMVKGGAMALAAAWLIGRAGTIRIWQVALVALVAQAVGMISQSLFFGGFAVAVNVVWTSVPGIALQIVAVWAICKLSRK